MGRLEKMKKIINIIIVMMFLITSSFGVNNTISNETEIISDNSNYNVNHNHILYVDFNHEINQYIVILLIILSIVSYYLVPNMFSAFIMLIISVILLANGFNLLLGFVIFLFSIKMIAYAKSL